MEYHTDKIRTKFQVPSIMAEVVQINEHLCSIRYHDVKSPHRGGGGGDRVPSCRHRAGGVGQFLAGMQFSTKVLKCVVIC